MEERAIIRLSSALVINLTKELKAFGKRAKDKVKVYFDFDRIIILCNGGEISILRPIGVDEEIWNNFIEFVIRKHGADNLKEHIKKEIRNALEYWYLNEMKEGYKFKWFGKKFVLKEVD